MSRLLAAFAAPLLALVAVPAAVGAAPGSTQHGTLQSVVDGLAIVEDRITGTSELLAAYRLRVEVAAASVADANRLVAEQVAGADELRDEYAAVLAGLDDRDRSRLEDEADARRGTSTMIRKVAADDWVCPVDGEMTYRDSWGEPRSGGRKHDGIDLVARSRTPVVASEAGTVTFRWDTIGGRSFDLVTAEGDYYFGTHLRSYGTEGEVEAGEVIGYVGRTGNAAGYHLHFEYHPGGKGNSINPFFLVDAHCR